MKLTKIFCTLANLDYFCNPKKIKTMFAIVDIAGHQYKVKANDTLFVDRLAGNAGDAITAKVLMTSAEGAVTLNSGSVTGEIIEHLQGNKVITFHKKRRKGFSKKIGHRHALTKVKITAIA
jgi:large subunit ribosomal protein L21